MIHTENDASSSCTLLAACGQALKSSHQRAHARFAHCISPVFAVAEIAHGHILLAKTNRAGKRGPGARMELCGAGRLSYCGDCGGRDASAGHDGNAPLGCPHHAGEFVDAAG